MSLIWHRRSSEIQPLSETIEEHCRRHRPFELQKAVVIAAAKQGAMKASDNDIDAEGMELIFGSREKKTAESPLIDSSAG
jgi:hypothetical protein